MSKQGQHNPPRWASMFLSWYCNPRLKEQIIGDAEELFYWRLQEEGHQKAKRAFVWDVIRFFRWRNIKRKSNQTTQFNNISMLKNYFKIGWRNILRQKMPSFINITGLSCAIGCCLVAFMFIEPRLVRDRFHENGDNIYLVAHEALVEGDLGKYGTFASGLSENFKKDFPQVKRVSRVAGGRGIFKIKDNIFNAYVNYVDADFLSSFSFPIIYGNKEALKDQTKIVIDKAAAETFFGYENPIGQLITLILNNEEKAFVVGGVIENPPMNSSLRPSFLLNYELLKEQKELENYNVTTFIELTENANVKSFESSLQALVLVQNGLNHDYQYESVLLEPLTSMSNSGLIGIPGGAPFLPPIILLSSIAGFMLLLSVSNYVNIAILMATRRVKEIGIRKTIGSRRSQLIVQFLTENLILCSIFIVLGCLLAKAFFLPWFNEMAGGSIGFNLLSNRNLWLFLGGLLIFITFLSGFYPALYISKFKPTVIFRGQQKLGRKWGISGGIITFQLTLSIITIVAGVMFVRTNNTIEGIGPGFDKEDKIVVNVPDSKLYLPLLNKMTALSGIERAVGTNSALGEAYGTSEFYIGDVKNRASLIECSTGYPEFMGLKLNEGRFFDSKLLSDTQSSIMINEKFSQRYDMKIDDLIQLDSVFHRVVGIVDDFHYRMLNSPIEPLIIRARPDSSMRYLTLKVASGTEADMKKQIQEAWVETVQNKPYFGFSQSDIFENGLEESRGLKNTMLFTATLATILAAMGIFGLASLSIASKMKDFGIMKALGANLLQLTKSVYIKFIIMLGIAVVLGSTLAFFIIGLLLDTVYPHHDAINFLPLSLAILILAAVAFVTITSQIVKVKRMNPADTLRME